MIHEFKKGDRVRCIDNDDGLKKHIKVGAEYEVHSASNGGFLMLTGVPGDYLPCRFEPVKPSEYRIRNSVGGVSFYTYTTADEAKEAARQSFLDGEEFDVIEVRTVAKYKVAKTLQAV